MVDPRIHQELDVEATTPTIPWRNDQVLDVPDLIDPADGDKICPDNAGSGGASDVILEWQAVTGATEYLVQWSLNSSFRGPTTKAVRTSSTSYNLTLVAEIAMGDNIHWRVMAMNGSGGLSEMSETRQIQYECDDTQTSGLGIGKSGGPPGLPDNNQKCKDYNVGLEIIGPDMTMCCDKVQFKAVTAWDCKDKFGRSLITPILWEWTLIDNPDDNGNVITERDQNRCNITIACGFDQNPTLRYCVTFTDLVNGGVFKCCVDHKFFVDCTKGLARYKPWLEIEVNDADKPVISGFHPDYTGSSITGDDSLRGTDAVGDVLYPIGLLPPPAGTVDQVGAPLDEVETQTATAVGPVVLTERQVSGGGVPYELDNKCAIPIDFGPKGEEISEARVNLAIGCGLQVDAGNIKVKPVDIVGGDIPKGLKVYGKCSIQVDPGCGLEIPNTGADEGKVRVKSSDLVGPGLVIYSDCGLQIDYGCGLDMVDDRIQIKTTLTTPFEFLVIDGASGGIELEWLPGCEIKATLFVKRLSVTTNECGVMFGPIDEGNETIETSVLIPTTEVSDYVRGCDENGVANYCFMLTRTEIDCS